MVDTLKIDLRIIAPTEVIDSLTDTLTNKGVEVTVSEVLDPSYLGLDLSTAADLVTIIGVTLISDPLVPALLRWFKPDAKRRRITVETPLGRVTLDTREPLTDEELRRRLNQIVKLL